MSHIINVMFATVVEATWTFFYFWGALEKEYLRVVAKHVQLSIIYCNYT